MAGGGNWASPLGNDHVGRDIVSRIMYGGRVSLAVGASAVLLGGVLGTLLGGWAGYRGGWADELIMRAVDVQSSIPFILLAIVFMAVFGVSLRTWSSCWSCTAGSSTRGSFAARFSRCARRTT